MFRRPWVYGAPSRKDEGVQKIETENPVAGDYECRWAGIAGVEAIENNLQSLFEGKWQVAIPSDLDRFRAPLAGH